MSEYLLLSIYSRYLESIGYKVERRVKLDKGAGTVDLRGTKGRKTIFGEARWIKTEGDVREAMARIIMNSQAYPKARHILVLEKDATSEEIELILLEKCYEHNIEMNFVDISDREIFEDILSVHIFPALHKLIATSHKILKKKPKGQDKQVLTDFLKPLTDVRAPATLAADIKTLIEKLK
ncbi:MAG: hypothetical protein ACFFCO_03055 [Promethearchaeota archaeon]